MAAVTGHFNFWNLSSEDALQKAWLRAGNAKTTSATIAILAITVTMSPIIVFGNSLVVLSVWRDPLKNLRSSPSNFILLSMGIADLLVGLVGCPLTAYWGWAVFHHEEPPFGPLASSFLLVNVSIGHMLLLTTDRFFALVTPLQYRLKVTNKRVGVATVSCWVYFLLFGCTFALWQKHFIILGTIYNLQVFLIIVCILGLYIVILYRFHKYAKTTTEALEDQSAVNRQQMLQRERTLCKAIVIIICVFFICFMPWFIVQILLYICIPCAKNLSLLMLVFAFTAGLMQANSAVNPFLYAWRLPKYRDAFRHFLNTRRWCHVSANRHVDDSFWDTRL